MKEEFTEETLSHLSQLCRIRCTPEEKKELATSLKKIVSHIEKLQNVDTEGFKPVYTCVQPTKNVLREDLPLRKTPREDILSNAAEHIGGMIRVPKVFS